MVQRRVLVVLFAVVAVSSVGIAVIRLWSQAESTDVSFEFDGVTRTCIVHVPLSYNNSVPTALVLVLHGYTGTAEGMEPLTRFNEKSDEEGFIVAYPQGLSQRWNVGFGSLKFDTDDVSFISELIDRLKEKYAVDPNKVYVTGFSNGAMMSYLLGAELSDKIAAIAPVAGSIGSMTYGFERIPEPSESVSVVVFHGTADTSVLYEGDGYFSVAESVAFWDECDGCYVRPLNETLADGNVIKSVYSGGEHNTEVILYTMIGLGHSWPTTPISATDVIWEFFATHPKQ